MLDHLDARAARRWVVDALEQLSARREEIDALNVYPVPDSDTGTNLCLTVEAGAAAVEDVPDADGLDEVTDAFARGALLGARGSSGVILSQLLRGWADVFRESPDGGPVAVRAALARAADQAYAAVARPVEGTMLTVARAAAEGARGRTLRDVVQSAVESARGALTRTTEQLDVLGRAGVVDAGGRGLVVVLESLSTTVQGLRDGGSLRQRSAGLRRALTLTTTTAAEQCDVAPLSGPAYEVMYLLDAPDSVVPGLRTALDGFGDTVVVVGGDGLWNVHVHTDDVAAAIVSGQQAGHLRRLRVASFARQRYERERDGDASGAAGAATVVPVVVDVPPPLASLVADHGAHLLPSVSDEAAGGEAQELDDLARSLLDAHVVLVPASTRGLAAAGAVAHVLENEGHAVSVLQSRSFVQALAAVSVHDSGLDVERAVRRMADAAAEVRWGAVAWGVSTWDSRTVGTVGDVRVHDDPQPAPVASAVLQRLLGDGGELLTVLPSGAVDDYQPVLDGLLHEVEQHHPEVEVTVLPADPASPPGLQLGAE